MVNRKKKNQQPPPLPLPPPIMKPHFLPPKVTTDKEQNTNNSNNNNINRKSESISDDVKLISFRRILSNRYLCNIIFNYINQINNNHIKREETRNSSSSSSSPSSSSPKSIKGRDIIERGSLIEMLRLNMTNDFLKCIKPDPNNDCFGTQMVLNNISMTDLFLSSLYYGNHTIAQYLANNHPQYISIMSCSESNTQLMKSGSFYRFITNDLFICLVNIYEYHNSKIPQHMISIILEKAMNDGLLKLLKSILKYCFKRDNPSGQSRYGSNIYRSVKVYHQLGMIKNDNIIDILRVLFKKGCGIFNDWNSVLQEACTVGNMEVVQFIQMNIKTSTEYSLVPFTPKTTCFSLAARLQSPEIFKYMCSWRQPSPYDISVSVLDSCTYGSVEVFDYLYKTHLSMVNPQYLSLALSNDNIAMVNYLLDNVRDIEWSRVDLFHRSNLSIELVHKLENSSNVSPEIYIQSLYRDSIKFKLFEIVDYIEDRYLKSSEYSMGITIDYHNILLEILHTWENKDGQDNDTIIKFGNLCLANGYEPMPCITLLSGISSIDSIRLVILQLPFLFTTLNNGLIDCETLFQLCRHGKYQGVRIFLENGLVANSKIPHTYAPIQNSGDPDLIMLFLQKLKFDTNNLKVNLMLSSGMFGIFNDIIPSLNLPQLKDELKSILKEMTITKLDCSNNNNNSSTQTPITESRQIEIISYILQHFPQLYKDKYFIEACRQVNTKVIKILYKFKMEIGYSTFDRVAMINSFQGAVTRGDVELVEFILNDHPKELLNFTINTACVESILQEIVSFRGSPQQHQQQVKTIAMMFDKFKEDYRKNDRQLSLHPNTMILPLIEHHHMNNLLIYLLELFISKKTSDRSHKCLDRSLFSSGHIEPKLLHRMKLHSLKHYNVRLFNYLNTKQKKLVNMD